MMSFRRINLDDRSMLSRALVTTVSRDETLNAATFRRLGQVAVGVIDDTTRLRASRSDAYGRENNVVRDDGDVSDTRHWRFASILRAPMRERNTHRPTLQSGLKWTDWGGSTRRSTPPFSSVKLPLPPLFLPLPSTLILRAFSLGANSPSSAPDRDHPDRDNEIRSMTDSATARDSRRALYARAPIFARAREREWRHVTHTKMEQPPSSRRGTIIEK